MHKMNSSRLISMGGVLSTLAVLFQSAPIFLPAFGMALSPLSTLPIAVAAIINVYLGLAVLLSTGFILTLISAQESMILIFTTGFLGLVIGTFLYRRGLIISIIISTIALSFGILALIYIVSIPNFIELVYILSIPLFLLILILFSFVYASIWNLCLRIFIRKIKFLIE
jgi:hypothetical protein